MTLHISFPRLNFLLSTFTIVCASLGFEIVPRTLLVADYVLSSEICVGKFTVLKVEIEEEVDAEVV